jgi:hypothetical protein
VLGGAQREQALAGLDERCQDGAVERRVEERLRRFRLLDVVDEQVDGQERRKAHSLHRDELPLLLLRRDVARLGERRQ